MRASRCQRALRCPDHIPEHLRRHAVALYAPGLVDSAEDRTVRDVESICLGIDRIFDPACGGTVRTWQPFPTRSAITQCSSQQRHHSA